MFEDLSIGFFLGEVGGEGGGVGVDLQRQYQRRTLVIIGGDIG